MPTVPLLRSRRLLPLLATQTLGAFNDNLFKNALVILALFRAAAGGGPALAAVAGGVFILPYIVLSATAGEIADRFDKAMLIRRTKILECVLMLGAAVGFWLGSIPVLMVVLFGLGVQATLFSPLKYGILPSHLAGDELVAGNGFIEAGTFLGILVGTIAGGAFILMDGGIWIVSGAGIVAALAGLAVATKIPPAPSLSTVPIDRNPLRATKHLLVMAKANRTVWLCLLGLSWFWTLGASVLALLPTVVRDVLHSDNGVVTLLLAFFSIGVGAGSVGCSRLLRGELSARPVPFATFVMSLALFDFAHAAIHAGTIAGVAGMLSHFTGWRLGLDIAVLGCAGGVFSVPLYALMQERSEPSHRSRMIAANNIVNAIAMAASAGLVAVLALAGVTAPVMLTAAAIINLGVAVWIVRLLPQEFVRGLFRWFFATFHGVAITGLENLPPDSERAIVVVNHQSFADGCFVAAFLPGAPVFAVNVHTAKHWWAKPFLAAVRTFLVDPANPFSTKSMVRAVRDGQRLVIFPEGRITKTGALMKVYEGAGMVADKAEAWIVPVHIDGLQYSKLSRMGSKVRRRWFPRLSLTVLPPVRVAISEGLLGRARRRAAGAQLQGLMETATFATADTGRTLFAALLDARDRHGAATPIAEDIARTPLSYNRLVLGACVLGRRLSRLAVRGEAVGVMLPNANGAVAAFFALQAFGRVPALLNFSAGAEAMQSACTACGARTVLTSRAFVERGKLGAAVARLEAAGLRVVWLEDERAAIGLPAKLRGMLDARRARALPGARAAGADGAACVLFTSGSEGTPKGVVLSHRNIMANIAQLSASVDFNPSDRVFNAMPMFHAFGLTGATLLPLLSGVRTFFYPSPLHYRIVPELIYDTDSTIAFGTDTFLQGWARFAHPYDFYAMRYIFAGAERVRPETKQLYAEKFGVRVLEGYGATEMAPVIALNTPMHSKPGAAGRLLPGIAWRLDPVPGIEEGGRLFLHGDNVMLGYYRADAPGVLQPPADGWYDTGDIATVDEAGFITLKGRAKRFAKIAGEMVSMPQAEALALALWPDAAHAVVSLPDARKGERLVLLTTQAGATASALLAHARAAGAAEIAVPREVRVLAGLPLLGSGKVDYITATREAGDIAVQAA